MEGAMQQSFNVELLNNYLVANKISKTAFCKQIKIDVRTLNKVIIGNRSPSAIVLFKIARALNVEIGQLYA